MKCIFCGGEATAVSENKFSCPYCGGTFEDETKPARSESHSKSLTRNTANEGANVFENNVNGVLEITWSPAPFCQTSGSGLLINDEGYALTNAHVVTDDKFNAVKEVNVRIAGSQVKASVIRLGDDRGGHGSGVDLALIKLQKIPANAKSLMLADFEKVRIGEQVFVIGNSLGDGTCITAGIVSDKQRKINGHTVLMTDCAINGGNSGGPIFNAKGEVIGVICSSRIQADGSATEGMNYAVPVNIAEEFLDAGRHISRKSAAKDGPASSRFGRPSEEEYDEPYVSKFGRPSEEEYDESYISKFGRPSGTKYDESYISKFGRPSGTKYDESYISKFGR